MLSQKRHVYITSVYYCDPLTYVESKNITDCRYKSDNYFQSDGIQ